MTSAGRIAEIKQSAQNCLDGMTYNKQKLARDTIDMCNTVEKLTELLKAEQLKSAQVKGGPNFADAFRDIFGGKTP